MKHFTKLLLFICGLIALLSAWLINAGNVKGDDPLQDPCWAVNESSDLSEEFYKNEVTAIQAYSNMLWLFRNSGENKKSENDVFSYSVDGIYASGFPDYYAGAYVNKNGNLVVLLTKAYDEGSLEVAKSALKEAGHADNLLFRTVETSYAELVDIMSALYVFCESDDYKNSDFTIQGFEIKDDRNCVVIYIDTLDDDALKKVRSSIKNPEPVEFCFQEAGEEETYTVNCGTEIGKTSTNMTFSIGYPAVYTNTSGVDVNGFITCGHSFSSNTTAVSVYCPSGYIGNLNPSKKQYSGTVDAAFVTLNGSVVDTYVGTTNISLNLYGSIVVPVGGSVKMYGMASLEQDGVVLVASYASTGTTPHLTDMVKTDYASAGGDSGGIVCSRYMRRNYYVAGIQSRKAKDGSYSVYCKVGNINSALGVTLE